MPASFQTHRIQRGPSPRVANAFASIIHLGLAIVIGSLWCMSAWAQTPAASSPTWAVAIDRIETLAGVDSKLTLEQVLEGQGGAFKAQQSLELEDPSWSKSFWAKVYLHPVAVSGQAAALGSVLEISKPYVADIALFSPRLADARWQWSAQQRGLRHPVNEGDIRSQDLLFHLPSASVLADQPEALRFVLLRVQHKLPSSFAVEVLPVTDALSQSYLRIWLLGMALGAIALVCVMTAALAWLHRDSAYAWYAAYAGSGWLFCVSITGFAHSVMWPVGGDWPVSAIPIWGLLATASKLQFCRKVFLRPDQDAWLHWSSLILGIVSVLVSLGYILQNGYWTAFTLALFALIVACVLLSLTIGAWGGIRNRALSKIWLVIFAPVILTIGYRLLEAVGLIKAHSVAFSSGIYILCLEAIIMGIAILWFARNRQGAKDRLLTLASTDPLTGFLDGKSFAKDLQQAWDDAKQMRADVSLVYVSLQENSPDERLLKRSVRILRTVTNEDDYLARLDERTLALLLPGFGLGDDLNAILSRIVALGLIPDGADHKNPTVQMRIAAVSRRHYQMNSSELDGKLRAFLDSDQGWEKKSIRFLPRRTSARFVNTDALENLWYEAVNAEKRDIEGPSKKLV